MVAESNFDVVPIATQLGHRHLYCSSQIADGTEILLIDFHTRKLHRAVSSFLNKFASFANYD